MTTLTAQAARLIETHLAAANQAATIAKDHIDTILAEKVIDNGLRGQLQALAASLDASPRIQAALRAAHERYGSAPVDAHLETAYEDQYEPMFGEEIC